MQTRYEMTADERERLQRTFTYSPPIGDQPRRYTVLRGQALLFAELITAECPPSVERDAALLKLSEAVMHANAAIARNEFLVDGELVARRLVCDPHQGAAIQ